MRRVDLKHVELRPPARFSHLPRIVHYLLLTLFLADWGFVCARFFLPTPVIPGPLWPEGLLLALALATTLANLAQRLPLQNILLAAALIATVTGGLQFLDARTGVPFGPFKYDQCTLGERLLWAIALWTVTLLNARGVARLILRPMRQAPAYGFWVLGFSAVLAVLFELALEPFATNVMKFWSGEPTRLRSDWYGVAWVNFIAWGVVAVLLLAFVTPVLIQKRPGRHPPSWHPLLVWVSLSALFLIGTISNHMWPAAAFTAVQCLLVLSCALAGASLGRNSLREGERPREPRI